MADLDDFDAALQAPSDSELDDDDARSPHRDARKALGFLDTHWYTGVSRRGRWMDLIGDYAGTEPFVVDGEALLQMVLDDPLLAVGRESDPSFQIAHAIYSLERTLQEIKTRSDSFDVVFWRDMRHPTLHLGGKGCFASRVLARTTLINHLRSLDLSLHEFNSITDTAWLTYQMRIKPMFVMTNDGSVLDDSASDTEAQCVLTQRVFILNLLAQGVAVTMLKGAQYRDSKILSFVHELRPDANVQRRLGRHFWEVVAAVSASLAEKEARARAIAPRGLDDLAETAPTSMASILKALPRVSWQTAEGANQYLLPVLLVFVAHTLCIPTLDLRERAIPAVVLDEDLHDYLVDSFLPAFYLVLERLCGEIVIPIDGRAFAALLNIVLSKPYRSLEDLVGPQVSTELSAIWPSPPELALLRTRFVCPPSEPRDPAESGAESTLRLLPFSHPLFDNELAAVGMENGADSELDSDEIDDSHLEFDTPYSDTQHWHNHRRAILPSHLGGETRVQMTPWQKKRQLRSEQRFMASLQRQAETLTGALGVPLLQMVIPSAAAGGARKTKVVQAPPARAPKPEKLAGKKGKKEHISSADKIRLEHAAKKQTKESDANVVWWREQLQAVEAGGKSVLQRIAAVEPFMRNKRTQEGWLAIEARLYRLHLEFVRWVEDSNGGQDNSTRDEHTVAIMRMAKDIYGLKQLFPTAMRKLATSLHAIGFADYVPALEATADVVADDDDRKLNFDFVKLVKSKSGSLIHKWMPIVEDPVNWQLRLFGEFMDRSMDSQSDRRVSFKPDAWQRDVLDCLDRNESVLVAAPTSAGKTFISYYAMEQVLRSSDTDILVYVAPTKALVTQIAAEVYARFRKELQGKACWAIHTRDYRIHNPQNCQILVTVPEMLAIMLLSPPLARTWSPRIKRIILDEIHTIGQQEGGAVWEQIILLAPCPIIGLSATIGDPETFNSWLASVQEAHGFKHNFIHHPHRYSHLRKFSYLLKGEEKVPFSGLAEHRSTDRLRFLHPISMLSFGARSLPPDFSLEAADCLSLYRIFETCRERLDFDVSSLSPAAFFAGQTGNLLRQKDILRYEAALNSHISTLIAGTDPQDSGSVLNEIIKHTVDPKLRHVDPAVPSAPDFYQNLITLAADLRASGDLPALLFNFDRKVCETMAKTLLEVMEAAEKRWRDTSPEWQRKVRQWEVWLSRAKDRERQAERVKKAKTKTKGDDDAGPPETANPSWEASFDPDEPSPQFSFTGTNPSYSKTDLEEEIKNMSRWVSVPDWAWKALRRGVGVHHAGMNKHYRTLVESLYRAGFLQVVIATGTLALGINAPTKTSVFCGDSPFLTALMYRQCAGRAGRRGFDLLGKVVFYGMPMDRCQRLVLSKLPSLGGNFPLTSTMVLRLFSLLQGSDNAPFAQEAIKNLLRLPQISFVSSAGRDQLLHHIRFSVDYLRRAGLLGASGNPINLFGVAAHLYYTEPGNLALVALLRHGVIHRICNQRSMLSAKREFLILMCHLFGRRYLPKAYASKEVLEAITRKSPSMVVMPPMPKDARKVLLEHDAHIRQIFSAYALAYVSHHHDALGEDNRLPFSGKTLSAPPAQTPPSPFRERLQKLAIPTRARSPFVATSGHGDTFPSISELTNTTRRGLHLNEHAIPSMHRFTAIPGKDDDNFALNAYLLDFYIHGQTAALTAANGIRSGEIWYVLQDFTLTLKALRTGLAQLLQATADAAAAAAMDTVEKRSTSPLDGEDVSVSELDSGYATLPADAPEEIEHDPEAEPSGPETFKRPKRVSDRDWRVFEIVDAVTEEFDEKFRKMWA